MVGLLRLGLAEVVHRHADGQWLTLSLDDALKVAEDGRFWWSGVDNDPLLGEYEVEGTDDARKLGTSVPWPYA